MVFSHFAREKCKEISALVVLKIMYDTIPLP